MLPLIVSELLAKSADVNAQDNKGNSALSWAARLPDGALVKLLLEHGADANTKVLEGQIARSSAVSEKVKALLEEAASAKEAKKPKEH